MISMYWWHRYQYWHYWLIGSGGDIGGVEFRFLMVLAVLDFGVISDSCVLLRSEGSVVCSDLIFLMVQ